MYVYIYIYNKISGKVDKPTLTMESAMLIFRSSLKKELLQNLKKLFFIHFPTYFLHLIRFTKIYHFFLSLSLSLYIYIYIYTRTYIYIYIYI